MNRHQRRKAKALRKLGHKGDGAMVVAVHEAGPAIAKVLAIGELGYSIDKAIAFIDIGTREDMGQSADGKMIMQSQAVTVGQTISKDMAAASREFIHAYISDHAELDLSALSQIVALGRAAGADIGKWFRARVFDAVTASITEAIFTKRTFYEVWNGYQTEGDLSDVVRDAKISGIAVNEVNSAIDRMAALSAHLMEKPRGLGGGSCSGKQIAHCRQDGRQQSCGDNRQGAVRIRHDRNVYRGLGTRQRVRTGDKGQSNRCRENFR